MFSLALCGFDFLHPGSAVRAVFRPIGTGKEQSAAYGTFLGASTMEQRVFQLLVQRKHRDAEPFTQQCAGNALDADESLAIVQQKAIPTVVVTALMDKPPGSTILRIVHDWQTVTQGLAHIAPV